MFTEQFLSFIEKQFKSWSKEILLELKSGKRNLTQKHCETILRALAANGKADFIQELFDYMKLKNLNIPLSINYWNKNDESALQLAAKHNRAEVFVLLVRHGGNVHLHDTKWNTVFNTIINYKSEAVLNAFFEHFPKYPFYDQRSHSAIGTALDRKQYPLAKRLIQGNIHLNACYLIADFNPRAVYPKLITNERITPLIHALLIKNYSRSTELLELGSDPNMGSETGVTPLEIWYHFFKEYTLHVPDSQTTKPAYEALMAFFRSLLERGADPLHSSRNKRSVLFNLIANSTVFMAEHPRGFLYCCLSESQYSGDYSGIYAIIQSMINHISDIERLDEFEQMNVLSFTSLCGCSIIAKYVHDVRHANPASVMMLPYRFETEITTERAKLNDTELKELDEHHKKQMQNFGYRYQDSDTAHLHPLHLYQTLSTTAERNHESLLYMLPLAQKKLKEVMKKEQCLNFPEVLQDIVAQYAAGQLPRSFKFNRLKIRLQPTTEDGFPRG